MTNSEQAIREFAQKWGIKQNDEPTFDPHTENLYYGYTHCVKQCLSDLTALISEHYVAKEAAGYPLEFVEWLIKDQEIFFGELNEEYILNDNIHVDGRKLQTINELFNYWVNNKK